MDGQIKKRRTLEAIVGKLGSTPGAASANERKGTALNMINPRFRLSLVLRIYPRVWRLARI
jgi:hypothetical protein